ncbi:MAG: tRNA adenosine(34) deaminase TadA [Clostridia bacterium]|nr:tRNA adenosine(34) deaminase TadA [Clostridia bacterium]
MANMLKNTDQEWMAYALTLARQAAEHGDVPVGAVLVREGEAIAAAGNRREADGVATAHAELLCVEQACRKLGRWRLSDCTLYVTLEPCPMCAGALINARIGRVVFGAKDAKAGACGSVLNMDAYPLNHRLRAEGGVLACECAAVLSEFFEKKRESLRRPRSLC